MIFNIYVDPEDEIIAIRARCMADLLAGSTVTSWTNEGTGMSKSIVMNTRELLEECNTYLQAKNPEKWGRKITSTKVYITY